jgi:hypothetical protein
MNGDVCTAGTLNEYRIRPTAYGGHCFYVRKTLPGDAVDSQDPAVCAVGGVIIPPAMGNQTVWFECRAIGANVGKPCSAVHAKKHRAEIVKAHGLRAAMAARDVPHEVNGKRLLIALPWPLVDERVHASPIADFEAFVEETLPLAYMVEDAA